MGGSGARGFVIIALIISCNLQPCNRQQPPESLTPELRATYRRERAYIPPPPPTALVNSNQTKPPPCFGRLRRPAVAGTPRHHSRNSSPRCIRSIDKTRQPNSRQQPDTDTNTNDKNRAHGPAFGFLDPACAEISPQERSHATLLFLCRLTEPKGPKRRFTATPAGTRIANPETRSR